TAGHTFGDAPGWWYPYLWSWGGKEIGDDKRTVALNSKETIESVKFAVALWKDTMDEGGLAWDDSSNNRAFLSGTISATNNGASQDWEKDAVWDLDPIRLPSRALPTIGRAWGFAGPPGGASAEAVTKYVIVDMYAKAIQGMAPEDAVKWAHDELVKIYS